MHSSRSAAISSLVYEFESAKSSIVIASRQLDASIAPISPPGPSRDCAQKLLRC